MWTHCYMCKFSEPRETNETGKPWDTFEVFSRKPVVAVVC